MPRRNHKRHKILPAERAALERERQRKQEAAKEYEEHLIYEMMKRERQKGANQYGHKILHFTGKHEQGTTIHR